MCKPQCMCHTPHYAHLDLEAERASSFGPLGGTKKGPWTVSWYGFSRHLLSLSPRILAGREREGDRGGRREGVIREQLCRSGKKRERGG
jgi:hypothetical protein